MITVNSIFLAWSTMNTISLVIGIVVLVVAIILKKRQ